MNQSVIIFLRILRGLVQWIGFGCEVSNLFGIFFDYYKLLYVLIFLECKIQFVRRDEKSDVIGIICYQRGWYFLYFYMIFG